MYTKYPLLSCISAVVALSLQGAYASEIGFSVRQDTVDSGVRLMVSPNDKVRSGDRLIIVDEDINENVNMYAVPFSDANRDGTPDNIEIQIPFGSQHALSVDIAPVDAQAGTVYCGLSTESWQGNFSGTGTEDIEVSGAQKISFDEACPNGYFDSGVSLRVDHTHVVAEAPIKDGSAGDVVLASFVCREVSYSPLGDCSKQQVARENAKASVMLQDMESNCSVTAQVVYAEERGRMIVGKEDTIRLSGYCLAGYTGIGFDISGADGSQVRPMGIISSSVKNWVIKTLGKYVGKKTVKTFEKRINACEIPNTWFWKVVAYVPTAIGWAIYQALKPCVAVSE